MHAVDLVLAPPARRAGHDVARRVDRDPAQRRRSVSLPTPDGPETITSIARRPPRRLRRTARSASAPHRRPHRPQARRGPRPARAGSGASARIRRPLDGDVELEAPGVEEQPIQAVGAASRRCRCHTSGRRRPDARSPRGGPGSGGSGPYEVELEERPAGEPLADAVAGRRRPAVGDDRHRFGGGSRPTGASIRPAGRRHGALDERQVRLLDPAGLQLRLERACAASVRATISRPLVSRSRRWTMPGRWTPAIPPLRRLPTAEQRVDQRAVGVAGRRVDHQARPACRRSAGRRPRRRRPAGSRAGRRARRRPAAGRRAASEVPAARVVRP